MKYRLLTMIVSVFAFVFLAYTTAVYAAESEQFYASKQIFLAALFKSDAPPIGEAAQTPTVMPTESPTGEPGDLPTETPEPGSTENPTKTPTAPPEGTATSVPSSTPTTAPTETPAPGGGPLAAFPGAVGYGTSTQGGRGGRVIYVTNLNDSGAGSLREAMTASGPRIVLFKVAGTISLRSDLTVTQPFLTVAGQTAPGEGVQVRDAQIKISTHDVIIRYLKVRSGDAPSSSLAADRDAVALNHDTNAYNIVVDHSTLIWGSDVGGITFLNGTHDATVSYSILGEGLYVSNHPEGVLNQGGHSMTMNITELSSSNHPTRITVHHNLFANASDRNPRIIGGELIDMINNVVFNWKDSPTQGNPRSLNLINNFYIKGPMSTNNNALVAFLPKVESGGAQRSGTVFESGNRTEGFTTVRGNPASVFTSTRFPTSINNPDSPEIAYDRIVADAGANRQVAGSNGSFVAIRDSVDARIINDLVDRTGTFVNGLTYGGVAGYPAIKYPTLATGTAAADSDNDGMPDDWEQKYFGNTSRGSESNSSGDMDGDGYTDVEEYINATDPTK